MNFFFIKPPNFNQERKQKKKSMKNPGVIYIYIKKGLSKNRKNKTISYMAASYIAVAGKRWLKITKALQNRLWISWKRL